MTPFTSSRLNADVTNAIYWYNRFFTNRVMLWDKQHGMWERPGGCGYTHNINEAGWFEVADVKKWIHKTGGRTEMRRK